MTVLILLVGLVDILVHLLVTVLVGLYLNRKAREHVATAATQVLSVIGPMLNTASSTLPQSNGKAVTTHVA